MKSDNPVLRFAAIALAWLLVNTPLSAAPLNKAADSLTLIVMDPLSRELACACVKGYGQRDYRKLAARLQAALNQPVAIEFTDDLADTLEFVGPAREILVVGDQSLISKSAKSAGFKCHPLSALTDRDGHTTLTASFVVRADDPAKELKEIAGRKLFIGLAEADQKYAATLAALREAGVEPAEPRKDLAYTDAALDLLDSEASPLPVAVLPSYALPMLRGCGSVKPGQLKVIGETQPIPFITVFASDKIPAEKKENILHALLEIKNDAKLLEALESRGGFTPISPDASKPATSATGASASWPDWRGPARDGRVARLPSQLASQPKILWKKGTMNGSLAGLTISGERLILAERDFADEQDVYRCFNPDTGELLWRIQYPAPGHLDYGQSPRAAPVIHGGRAFLLGAFGHLRCVDLANGKTLWQRHLLSEFGADLPTWGTCSPPLIVDDLLIVNPGSTNASLAALDYATGATRWTTPGFPAAYSAFISGTFAGRRQIVGYDDRSLGGWDVKTGERLWQLIPPTAGDFNVPTPIVVDGSLLVSTENNGTRLYRFDESGRIIPTPKAHFADLSPDTTSPIVTSGRVFGADSETLYCFDLANGLKPIWQQEENALGDHVTFLADDERVLVMTIRGELILLNARADQNPIISRMRLFEDDVEAYSHPALVGNRLFARAGSTLVCVDLESN